VPADRTAISLLLPTGRHCTCCWSDLVSLAYRQRLRFVFSSSLGLHLVAADVRRFGGLRVLKAVFGLRDSTRFWVSVDGRETPTPNQMCLPSYLNRPLI
jgi:hypothetical protein